MLRAPRRIIFPLHCKDLAQIIPASQGNFDGLKVPTNPPLANKAAGAPGGGGPCLSKTESSLNHAMLRARKKYRQKADKSRAKGPATRRPHGLAGSNAGLAG